MIQEILSSVIFWMSPVLTLSSEKAQFSNERTKYETLLFNKLQHYPNMVMMLLISVIRR